MKTRVEYITSPESVNQDEYRIIVRSIGGCICAAILIFLLWFPHGIWDDILMLSVPIGFFLGLILGVVWHLFIRKRIYKPFAKGLAVLGLFFFLFMVATTKPLFVLLTEQNRQMSSIRSLSKANILQADFIFDSGDRIVLTDNESIKAVKGFLADAKISKLKRKSVDTRNAKVEIKTSKDSFAYEAYLLSNHPNDIGIKISENADIYLVHLAGLKRWLDENILNKKE
jgi:hypothetical protein